MAKHSEASSLTAIVNLGIKSIIFLVGEAFIYFLNSCASCKTILLVNGSSFKMLTYFKDKITLSSISSLK
jgi:hypothetical protein